MSPSQNETAVIILAALFEGPNVDAIVRLTGSSREVVEAIASRMRASSIWADQEVDYGEYEKWLCGDISGDLALARMSLVAQGHLIRTAGKRNGRWVYAIPREADC